MLMGSTANPTQLMERQSMQHRMFALMPCPRSRNPGTILPSSLVVSKRRPRVAIGWLEHLVPAILEDLPASTPPAQNLLLRH